jgi:ubiquinone/menaquinone biosynthesis C-methylase UbiE
MLELIRKYAWTRERRTLLYKYLELQPSHIVVDVGCGTGAFTRVIAAKIDPSKGGKIIGIDRNPELLKAAKGIARASGFGNLISFKKGDAIKSIPLPDNYADRVICQAFLWLMTNVDRIKAIKEMIRVCKPGGLIGACEGALDSSISHVEGNEHYNRLLRKRNLAMLKGYKIRYGYNRRIGYLLPTFFKNVGLERVRLDGVVHVHFEGDDRVPLDFKIEEKKHSIQYPKKVLATFDRLKDRRKQQTYIKKMEPSLLAGGMSYKEIVELMRLEKSHAEEFLQNPELFKRNTSSGAGITFITTGLKPQQPDGLIN